MKGYKGFEKGLVCLDKQYAENTVFEEEKAEICASGMHFCENPLDCLDYYPLINENGELNDFAEVEALDEVKTDDNKKYCTKKLKVGAKLSLAEFVKASFEVTKEQIEREVKNTKTKGKDELSKVGGDWSNLVGGDSSNLVGGNWSKLVGGYSSNLVGGDHSVIVGENGSVAKGKKGALIVLVEREWKDGEYVIKAHKTELVDGERIKEDTYYKLTNGEFVETK